MQRRFVICLIALSVLLAIDIGTKEWALRRLSVPGGFHRSAPVCEPENSGAVLPVRSPSAPVTVIDGIFEMRYTENCGAAFGLLREAPPWLRKAIFYSAALFASAVLLAMLWRGHGGQIFAVSVPLIVSGALGNWFDRVRFGYVVDFIYFYTRNGFWIVKAGSSYPTFNFADICISVGVGLLIIDSFFGAASESREPAAAPQNGP